MADSAVGFLINKLDALLDQEIRLLRGVREEVAEIKDELESMRSFLRDADARKEREEGVKTWVKQVRNAAYHVEDLVDEFMLKFSRQHSNGCMGSLTHTFHSLMNVRSRHDIATKIQILRRRIDRISQRKDMYKFERNDDRSIGASTSSDTVSPIVDESNVVGIDAKKQVLTDLLLKNDDESVSSSTTKSKAIAVWGKDGLGKTTLVSIVFNSQEVQKRFDCTAWVQIPESGNRKELMITLVKGLFEDREEMVEKVEEMNVQTLQSTLRKYLGNKTYLIVFDDIISIGLWDSVKVALPRENKRSRIVVTTPSNDVAKSLENDTAISGQSLEINPLNDEDSMELFCMKAFPKDNISSPPSPLKGTCEKMVKRCDGWPLAIKALGKAMSKRSATKEEWEKADKNIGLQLSSNPSLDKVRSVLSLAYSELPLHLRSCFLYCSLFPEDCILVRNTLIRLWIAEGLIQKRRGSTQEEIGEEYLNELVDRSLLQVVEYNARGRVKACRINVLILNMAMAMADEEDFIMVLNRQGGGLNEKARRLSVHNADDEAIRSTMKMCNLRSLFIFSADPIKTATLSRLFSSFKFLRVFVLENAAIEGLPSGLGDLFHLRYLGLRESDIEELPDSLDRLHNLQTMDIRETDVKTLPAGAFRLENMRHLLMRPSIGFYPLIINEIRGVKVPGGINKMRKLKTLTGIRVNQEIVNQIGSLFQLRKLEVFRVKEEFMKALCDSIQQLSYLTSLSIFCSGEDEPLEFGEPSWGPPPHVKALELAGKMVKLPKWVYSLENLSFLGLYSCQIKDKSFLSFQFPSLTLMKLYHAYSEKDLVFKSGFFPQLKTLHLMYLNDVEEVIIEDQAMPSLVKMEIYHCNKLKMVPEGIEAITTLKELELVDMPIEFVNESESRFANKTVKIECISKKGGDWI